MSSNVKNFLNFIYSPVTASVAVTSNASRHFKSPLAMGEILFETKCASFMSISVVIDTKVSLFIKKENNSRINLKMDLKIIRRKETLKKGVSTYL